MQQLPNVNREFARKLLEKKANDTEQVVSFHHFLKYFVFYLTLPVVIFIVFYIKHCFQMPTPFEDERFKDMFTNPDFEIKETDDEYVRAKATFERTNKKKVTLVPEEEPVNMFEVCC